MSNNFRHFGLINILYNRIDLANSNLLTQKKMGFVTTLTKTTSKIVYVYVE